MSAPNIRMNTCRLCGAQEYGNTSTGLIKYGVRHYAHPDCALNEWGHKFFDRLTPWQAGQFPVAVAQEHGVLDACVARAQA